jgi:hypothetical protein
MAVTAEYKGFSYTFDPRAQAMRDLGITEETAENQKALAVKNLEYTKTAHVRAYVKAVLGYTWNQIEKGEEVCADAIFSALRAYSPPF